jgi:hypothetical protein
MFTKSSPLFPILKQVNPVKTFHPRFFFLRFETSHLCLDLPNGYNFFFFEIQNLPSMPRSSKWLQFFFFEIQNLPSIPRSSKWLLFFFFFLRFKTSHLFLDLPSGYMFFFYIQNLPSIPRSSKWLHVFFFFYIQNLPSIPRSSKWLQFFFLDSKPPIYA